jgi:hypothetical protein
MSPKDGTEFDRRVPFAVDQAARFFFDELAKLTSTRLCASVESPLPSAVPVS